MVDYAQHLIKMEYMMRIISDLCLAQNYDKANDIALQLGAENKLLMNTLLLMTQEQKIREERRRNGNGRSI
jgi:hypothetical protein